MQKHESIETPEYKRQQDDPSELGLGFSALDIPHEDYASQSASEKGIVAKGRLRKLGRLARTEHEQKDKSLERPASFIKGVNGTPDKMISHLPEGFLPHSD